MSSIAHMLTRIRNAHLAGHESVIFPFSKITHMLAEVLEKEHFVRDVTLVQKRGKKYIQIELRYNDKEAAIHGLRLVSRPSQRIYLRKGELARERKKMGLLVVSTSKGLLPYSAAKKQGVGGEVICEIW